MVHVCPTCGGIEWPVVKSADNRIPVDYTDWTCFNCQVLPKKTGA